jgi:predicted glycosyltransferase involved in capsule biosynthesis
MSQYKLSIIIPWRNSQLDRNNIAQWCFARYKYLFPDAEFIYCDSGDTTFSKAKSLNQAVPKANGNYIIITDADYLFSSAMAKEIVNKQPWTVAARKENYFYLSENMTKEILTLDSSINLKDINIPITRIAPCPFEVYGGVWAFPKENFIKLDNLNGYGYDDNIWYDCMNAQYGQPFKTNNKMYHMHHDRPITSDYMQKCYINESYYKSTWLPIKENRKQIRKLILEKGLI